MTSGKSSAAQRGASPPERPERRRAARVCGIACVAMMLSLSFSLLYAYAGVGCYMGLILMVAATVVLGGTALILLVVSTWLRPTELLWLIVAGVLIAFSTGLALQHLPAVVCGYPG
ncbi:MAG: hypothetical protein ACREO0_14445 [Pseudoxanthomonas sp.]